MQSIIVSPPELLRCEDCNLYSCSKALYLLFLAYMESSFFFTVEIETAISMNCALLCIYKYFMQCSTRLDAVTGTEKEHVNRDYRLRLDQGTTECQEDVSQSFRFVRATDYIKSPPTGILYKF